MLIKPHVLSQAAYVLDFTYTIFYSYHYKIFHKDHKVFDLFNQIYFLKNYSKSHDYIS